MLRCAIYTRKSTEEGLEQDFNSLHAQREACEAYIKSQRHEGWRLVRTAFDDGGYSGGNTNRPALQLLLEAVGRNQVDVIVVYKVDRLTRALNDFSKIVDQLDGHGVSFVSVTQQFNTTTSMGRLTLNMLLSFAQFEREVTAERISDKIAASKKKGLWMGGPPPLGYDNIDKKLVINKPEAATVGQLFDLYLELGTVRQLSETAIKLGIVTKRRKQRNEKQTGGSSFSRGNLYQLLSNPLYVAMVPHKGNLWPGQHEAIIEQKVWDDVQQMLSGNAVDRSSSKNHKAPFLLTGKVYDETGDLLYQSQADKNGRRYRYYVSRRLMHEARCNNGGWRVPAKTLESIVVSTMKELLSDTSRFMDMLQMDQRSVNEIQDLVARAKTIHFSMDAEEHEAILKFLQDVIRRIDLSQDSLNIHLNRKTMADALNAGENLTDRSGSDELNIVVPVKLRRRGVETRLVIAGTNHNQVQPDKQLCQLVANARYWYDQLASGTAKSIRELSKRDGVAESEVTRILPLAFLSPTIVESILEAKQPDGMSLEWLKRLSPFPCDWKVQADLIENLR
ncbi:MAG: recombinase family protein [Alphaproteobacteria bacterium]|jgi:site-specific DNA recombinase|nr:recombinase family protein [Alphaproteobacteria bacterium]